MPEPSPCPDPTDRMTPRHWLIVLVLSAVQFTHIVDFMIVMPLFPHLQRDLGVSPREFAVLLSSYSLAACAAGFVLARLLDRFDRKRSLLFLFLGFTAGTFVCAFAPDFRWLLAGRLIAGGFGGVAGAAALAIIGDAIPLARRGTATGAMMSSFSLSTIAGVPAGLVLAESFPSLSWRAPFIALGVLCLPVLAFAAAVMPPLRSHLRADFRRPSLLRVLAEPAYVRAYVFMFALYLGGFVMFSFLTPYLVATVGIPQGRIFLIYLCGGLTTFFSVNLIGRLSDRYSRRVVFQVTAAAFAVPAVIVTYLPQGTPLAAVLAVTTLLMVFGSGRGTPAMALVTTIARAGERGSFLSITSSVQQAAMTVAPLVTAAVVTQEPGGPLRGYEYAGWLSAGLGLLCVWLVTMMRPADEPVMRTVAVPACDPVESIVSSRDARLVPAPPRG